MNSNTNETDNKGILNAVENAADAAQEGLANAAQNVPTRGTNKDDRVEGGSGNDTIAGEGGSDYVEAGAGDDILYGDKADGHGFGQDATPIELNINNLVETSYSNGWAEDGDYAIYKDVAFLEDGSPVYGRLIIEERSDPNLSVTLDGGPGYEMLLYGNGTGDTAKMRLEFFDPESGDPVTLNATATFNDLDRNSVGDQEAVMLDATSFTAFGTDANTNLNVTQTDTMVKAAGSQQNNPDDEAAWLSAKFEDRSFIEFTLESRSTGSGFTLSGDKIQDPVYTEFQSGNDTIMAGEGNDTVFGQEGADHLEGGEGNDAMLGGEGDDSVDGGSGNDTLTGGTGGDTLRGGEGNDYIEGGEGNDFLSTGIGQDTLFGGEGDDTLTNSAGDDSMSGGTGNDSIIASEGNDTLEGGTGDDTMEGGVDDDVLRGDEGHDRMQGDAGHDSLEGGLGNDTMLGGEGDDTLLGGDGNDYLEGGAGNDLMRTGLGDDTLYGGEGDDTLTNSAGDDSLVGGTGNDSIVATEGNDTLEGGDGNDTMFGGADEDVLSGGTGDDSMSGEADADTFILEDGFGNDTIVGGELGNDDDTIDMSAVTAPVTVVYDAGDGEAGTVTSGINSAQFSEIENIIGGSAGDTFDGTATTGGLNIDAGAGDDTIAGGSGSDTLAGGAGDDTFELHSNSGQDYLVDFDLSDDDADGQTNDQLDVSELSGGSGRDGAISFKDVVVSDDGSGNAVLTFPEGEQLVLNGVAPASVSSPAQLQSIGIPCFTSGTQIMTPSGPASIETLKAGDMVVTGRGAHRAIRWIGARRFGPLMMRAFPSLRPIRITAGCFGAHETLTVSPQHGVALRFNGEERLVRASHLSRIKGGGVRRLHGCRDVTYFHLLLETHDLVWANGLSSESFYPGPIALQSLSPGGMADLQGVLGPITYSMQSREIERLYGPSILPYSRMHWMPDHIAQFSSPIYVTGQHMRPSMASAC